MKKIEVFEGDELSFSPNFVENTDDSIYLFGESFLGHPMNIPLSQGLLSKHVLILGNIGSGKTNVFFQILDQLSSRIKKDDVIIIFDTKGEFYESFYKAGDIVISNDGTATGRDGEDYWNIFREIDDDKLEESIMEIASTFFEGKISSTTQKFFPMAAKDIFAAILTHFYRSKDKIEVNNALLREFLDIGSADLIRKMLSQHEDLANLISYIDNDKSGQTQGVLSELQQAVREILIGNFKKEGSLSIRDAVRNKDGRKIFVEYDLASGKVLSPIYTLLFDLAIKQALSRKKSQGNVYFIIDEFSLLPNLSHLNDAINFGRSLGVKFIIGVQNIEQIYDSYKEYQARSILSGLLTSICFKVNEESSRKFIKDLYGRNRKKDTFISAIQNRGIVEQVRDSNVVEDWNISNLKVGEAIIGLANSNPFLYKFKKSK